MAEMICSLCGEKMNFDDFTKAWVCPVCGHSVREDAEPATPAPEAEPAPAPAAEETPAAEVTAKKLPSHGPGADVIRQARAALAEEQYEQALQIIADLKKKHLQYPRTFLITLFCGYQAGSTQSVLEKASSSSALLQKVAERADWKDLAMSLPSDQRDYVKNVIEYCAMGIVLLGDAKKIVYGVAPKSPPPTRKVQSAFSKMDEEEVHNMERQKSLRDAQKPKVSMNFNDLREDYDERFGDHAPAYYETRASSDYSGVDFALDVLDLVLGYESKSTRTNSFFPRMQQEVMSESSSPHPNQSRQRRQPSALSLAVDRISKSKTPREELAARQEEVLEKINEIERKIFESA
ncbi:MAG: hypothetical protein J6040_07845 [Clostridiales bacterium]|nr:hypothetical protein [Clostridiales bacterium]MBP5492990.1 hypothetical protein [Clostridiales bacterium]